MFVSRIALFALPALAAASALLPRDGAPSCSTGAIQCCKSTQNANSLDNSLTALLVLLGINVSDITGQVGVTCAPITVVGTGTTSCSGQALCCSNNNYNGAVALGCTPVSLDV